MTASFRNGAATVDVTELAAKILLADPSLLPQFAATAVAVDAHATALKTALRRFNNLERRLCRVVERLAEQTPHLQPTEQEFAEFLDYIGSSDVRVRVAKLGKTFPP